MDSLTQFALGAGVGLAVLSRRIGPRRAALTGGVLGTLPDLDVLFPFDDPVDSFILHRGATHSFFVHALVTPIFGEVLVRLFKSLREERLRSYLAVYLIFVTHAIIDALTIYGTRVFWPLFPEPVGAGSVFIIDPLYTLPLLFVMIWAFFRSSWSPGFGRAVTLALVLSTAYMGWGLAAQQWAKSRAAAILADAGIAPERLMASPTPFNTLLWKAIAVDGDRYVNLYVPLFGARDQVTAYLHPRGTERLGCLGDLEALQKLAAFSDGFYRLDEVDEEILVSDLRMGMTPNYVFRFAVAEATPEGFEEMAPQRRRIERSAEGDIDWLLANLSGEAALRPAEATRTVDLTAPAQFAQAAPQPTTC